MLETLPEIMQLEDFKILAIHHLDPDARFSILGGVIHWDESNKNSIPSDSDLETKALELQKQHKNLQYSRDRRKKFPSIQDQLDMQYHDQIDGTTTWKDAIAKVKADHPKEAE